MNHAVLIHVLKHLRVRVRCERLRVPCAACHVPPVVNMSEAANINLAPKPTNGNAETPTC